MTVDPRAPSTGGMFEHPAAGSGAAPGCDLDDGIWDWLFSCETRLLILGFDDTLARYLTPHRGRRLTPAIARALKALTDSSADRVVVHSAGSLEQLRQSLSSVPADLFGENGWEESPPHGRKSVHSLPARTQRRLAQAAAAAEECGWRSLLVRRRSSLLLRTRGLTAEQDALMRELGQELWSSRFETDGLRVASTSSGVELRATERNLQMAIGLLARRLGGADVKVVEAEIADRVCVEREYTDDGIGRPDRLGIAMVSARARTPRELLHFIAEWSRQRRTRAGRVREFADRPTAPHEQ